MRGRVVRGSAPGKVILFGEHAVVHGKLCVAASLGLRTRCHVELPGSGGDAPALAALEFQCPSLGLSFRAPTAELCAAIAGNRDLSSAFSQPASPGSPDAPLGRGQPSACSPATSAALRTLVHQFQRWRQPGSGTECGPGGEQDGPPETHLASLVVFLYLFLKLIGPVPARVVVTSDLPLAAGLGSSASFCVALAAAFLGASASDALSNAAVSPSSAGQEGIPGADAPSPKEAGAQWQKVALSPSLQSLINAWAFEGERIIHGTPSGVDNEVCCQGGILTFRLGKSEALPCVLPLRVLLTHTLVPRNTRTLVAGVRDRLHRHPAAIQAVFEAVDAVAQEAVRLLARSPDREGDGCAQGDAGSTEPQHGAWKDRASNPNGVRRDETPATNLASACALLESKAVETSARPAPGDAVAGAQAAAPQGSLDDAGRAAADAALDELVQLNQGLLRCLGVSHERIEKVCAASLAAVGVHSKLTGAGGGGCVLTLLPPRIPPEDIHRLQETLQADGFQTFDATVGCEGAEIWKGLQC